MWTDEFLKELAPLILLSEKKVQDHYSNYVKQNLKKTWSVELDRFTSLIDFRDYAEDVLSLLATNFEVDQPSAVTIDRLVKSLKMTPSKENRKEMTIAFLEENALSLSSKLCYGPFIQFAIDVELKNYFDLAAGLGKIRPVLSCSVEVIEAVVKKIDTSKNMSVDTLKSYAVELGLSSLWPVFALIKAHHDGDVEELFLHVPLPKVFGAPSCVRNSLNRAKVSTSEKTCRLVLDNAVIAGTDSLCWKTSSGWITKEALTAHLIAALPGRRSVWCLDPNTMKAAVYTLEPFRVVLEFELPFDDLHDQRTNWIDCQRDSEGALVLIWGTINPLTGALHSQNVSALNEEALFSNEESEILASMAPLPNRRRLGYKVDWRDHGNLLSVHHQVVDAPGPVRKWTHNYDIVFAETILLSLETEGRPIEAIFGSPKEMILLSPLSAMQGLQLWTNQDEYKLKETARLPKCPKGQWTSMTVNV